MLPWVEIIITALVSVFASSGFWAYWSKKNVDKSCQTKLLRGLAHDRIIQSGRHYLERQWISDDEYENLYDYLYIPYKELGGNGSAQRVIELLKDLPRKPPPKDSGCQCEKCVNG